MLYLGVKEKRRVEHVLLLGVLFFKYFAKVKLLSFNLTDVFLHDAKVSENDTFEAR